MSEGNNKTNFQLDDDWELFEEQFHCYFITKNITDDRIKVATLVTRLGDNAHALLKQLVAPAKITTKSYAKNMTAMTNHLKPKPSVAMERYTFHTAKQDHNETIADYAARLRKLALNCNFGNLDDALKDQFVCGVEAQDIKIKLFEEKELTLAKALDIATAREAAAKSAAATSSALDKKNMETDVYAMQSGSKQQQYQRGSGRWGRVTNSTSGRYERDKQQQQHRPASATAGGGGNVSCYYCGEPSCQSHLHRLATQKGLHFFKY